MTSKEKKTLLHHLLKTITTGGNKMAKRKGVQLRGLYIQQQHVQTASSKN